MANRLLILFLLLAQVTTAQVYRTMLPAVLKPVTNSVLLLLSGGGSNGSTSFTDSGPYNRTVTRTGSVTNSTAQKQYGTSSILFPGSSSYLSLPDATELNFGSNDFTLEGFLYPTASSGYRTIMTKRANDSQNQGFLVMHFDDGTLRFFTTSDNSNWNLLSFISFGSPTVNAWNHWAICRQGSNWYFFLNGSLNSTQTASGAIAANTNPLLIGGDSNTAYYPGYMHVRVSNKALYTASFTPPTTFGLDLYLSLLLLLGLIGQAISTAKKNIIISRI